MKSSSIWLTSLALFIVTAFFPIETTAQNSDLTTDLRSSFTKFDVVRVDHGGRLRSNEGSKTLRIQAAGRDLELVMMANDLRSERYRAEDTNMIGVSVLGPSPVTTYKGFVAGEAESKVRLTIDGVRIEGFFETAGDRMFIEPASKYSRFAQPGDSVIYRAEDSLKDNTFFCESDIPGKIEFGRELAAAGAVENMMLVRVLELATEADAEWVSTLGGATQANNDILGILNMVEGTFSGELNLTISVVYQHTWSTTDPFGAADMNGVLVNFRNYWNTNNASISRDTAHLFSGKTVAQSRGLAYLGVVCRAPGAAYGLSGYIGWAPGKFLVPAHELGHNLGADHADAAQNCANSLMNPTLSGSTPMSFCSFSRDAITTYVAANGSCLSEVQTATGSVCFDFDGDRRSDISIFRPSNGVWYLNRSGAGFSAFQFGIAGDKPVSADYDGDGRSDAAVYRAGIWYRLRSTTNTMDAVAFGLSGDVPAPADFDGDDKADVGVFRPSNGVWYSLASANGAFSSVRFGISGDIPVAADYDGDGKADITVFRPSNGTWYRINSANGSTFAMNFGLNGDKPLMGDFDGDARSDIAVWRPANGVWYVMRSATGSFSATAFGLNGDVPAPADYDGDARADISVFRPSNGVWYRLNSANGSFAAVAFGVNGDNPVPSYYVP